MAGKEGRLIMKKFTLKLERNEVEMLLDVLMETYCCKDFTIVDQIMCELERFLDITRKPLMVKPLRIEDLAENTQFIVNAVEIGHDINVIVNNIKSLDVLLECVAYYDSILNSKRHSKRKKEQLLSKIDAFGIAATCLIKDDFMQAE